MAAQSVALARPRRRVRQRDVVPYLFILPNLVLFAVDAHQARIAVDFQPAEAHQVRPGG